MIAVAAGFPVAPRGERAHLGGMVRAVFSLVGILAVVWIIVTCYGYTTPQVTTMMPALNRSVARTVALMSGGSTGTNQDLNATVPEQPHPGPAAGKCPFFNARQRGLFPAGLSQLLGARTQFQQRGGNHQPRLHRALESRAHSRGRPAGKRLGLRLPATARRLSTRTRPHSSRPSPCPRIRAGRGTSATASSTTWSSPHVDADMVTITADSGPAQIDIALLPLEIRQELHYDPVLGPPPRPPPPPPPPPPPRARPRPPSSPPAAPSAALFHQSSLSLLKI